MVHAKQGAQREGQAFVWSEQRIVEFFECFTRSGLENVDLPGRQILLPLILVRFLNWPLEQWGFARLAGFLEIEQSV